MATEVEMAAMAIAAVQADFETVAAHEGWQAVTPPNAQAFQRHGLVEKLHACLLA